MVENKLNESIQTTYRGGVVFVPSCLDIVWILDKNLSETEKAYFTELRYRNRRIKNLLKFLTLLKLNYDQRYDEKSDYVAISATEAKRLCGQFYREKVIRILEKASIIEIFKSNDGKESYSNRVGGEFTKKYRILPLYADAEWVPVDDDLRPLAEKIYDYCEFAAKMREKVQISGETEEYLFKFIKLMKMAPEARVYFSQFYFPKPAQRQFNYLSMLRVESGLHFFSRNPRTGRLYHTITSLPAKHEYRKGEEFNLRQFLIINGEPLISLDIRASQPFFAHLFYAPTLPDSPEAVSEERNRYLSLFETNDGSFYENVGSQILRRSYSKKEMKKAFISQYLFATHWDGTGTKPYDQSPWSKLGREIFRAFEKEFPILTRLIRALQKKPNAAFCNMLQRYESKFILDTVCPALIEMTGGQIPLITIHDCIMTTRPFADLVEKTMNELFIKCFAVAPFVKREGYSRFPLARHRRIATDP